MAQRGRRAMLSTGASGDTAATMARQATARAIPDVSRLVSGRLKMVGVPHDKRVGMVLPTALVNAWEAQARAEGVSRTDLFEGILLAHLEREGWEFTE